MQKEVYLKIDGRVQGIGFRAWAVRTAKELNVSGWVRNVDDGTVEIRMKGEEDQIDEMIKRAYQGPMLARVDEVKFLPKPPSYFLPEVADGTFFRI